MSFTTINILSNDYPIVNTEERLIFDKTLSQYLQSVFEIKIKRKENLTDEEFDFLLFVKKTEREPTILEKKKKLIPDNLFSDVCAVVRKHYAGNWEDYFNDILYFEVFTLRDFFLARLDKQKLNKREQNINKIANTNLALKRKIKNEYKKRVWHAQVLLKLIGGKPTETEEKIHYPTNYISDALMLEYKNNYKNNQAFIRNNIILSKDGDIIPLSQCVKTAEQKLAETLNIIEYFEKKAEKLNNDAGMVSYDWIFITLTLKPELHPNPTKGNFSYNGTAPYISAKQQKNDWNTVRALLKKQDILPTRDYWGSVISECHLDGCQHLHLIIFYPTANYKEIRDAFFSVFPNLNDDQDSNKCSFKLNNGKAKATSYAFKYLHKATSNFDTNLDIFAETDKDGVIANSAFRSYNGIRGVSHFGIANCLTKFRFLAKNLWRINSGKEDQIETCARLETIIEQNDLYSFIEEGHHLSFKCIYITTKNNIKKFIGIEGSSENTISGILYLKGFFLKVIKEAVKEISLIPDYLSLLTKTTRETIKEAPQGLVLVSPNYSSKRRKPEKPKKPTDSTIKKSFGFHNFKKKEHLEIENNEFEAPIEQFGFSLLSAIL